MKSKESILAALEEQRKSVQLSSRIISFAMPVGLAIGLYFMYSITSPDDQLIRLVATVTLLVFGLPIYIYLLWFYRKEYNRIMADIIEPDLRTIQSELLQLSRRYDDDAGVDHYVAKFRNNLTCRIKSDSASKLRVNHTYGVAYFTNSNAVFEIKGQTNKTLIDYKSIIIL